MQLNINSIYLCAQLLQMSLEESILPRMGKTMKLLDLHIEDKLVEAGIPLTKLQFVFLMIIARNDGQPQNFCAELTGRDKTTFTRNFNTLERRALVSRTVSPTDKRSKLVSIMPLGKELLEKSKPIIAEIVAEIEGELTKSERDVFVGALDKIKAKLMMNTSETKRKTFL